MGYQHSYNCADMVIASSGTNSTALAANPHFENASSLIIEAPDTLTAACTLYGSFDDATSYSQIYSGGAAITLTAAKSVSVTNLGWTHIRVTAASAEGAERTFKVRATEEVG